MDASAKQVILFIGLGMMGSPMAALLAKAAYPLLVADADTRRASAFADAHGATAVDLRAPGWPAADVVITMLPSSSVVEQVVLGDAGRPGLLALLKPGVTLIDMGTSEPLRSRELAQKLSNAGIGFIDAPVSGGVKRAVEGSLAIMAGGDKDTFEAVVDILGCMGENLFHVGGPGAGHAMKALNNYVSASGLVAAVDAMHVGERFGLSPAMVIDVLNASSGRNNATENQARQFMLNGKYDSGFSLQLMVKDLTIASELATGAGYAMPMASECLALWADASGRLDRVADHTEMYHLMDGSKPGTSKPGGEA